MNAKNPKPSAKPIPAGVDWLPDHKGDDAVPSGRVKHDDRDNAVWEWAMVTGADDHDVPASVRSQDASLSIATDAPSPVATVRPNPLGAKKGYDPYDSGRLGKSSAPRKKDLRKLSEWHKLKKQIEANRKKADDE